MFVAIPTAIPIWPFKRMFGTADGRTNIMTAGWTGTVCTVPPMAYVSIRPSRVSYDMIRESGEFVLNLNTEKLAVAASFFYGFEGGFCLRCIASVINNDIVTHLGQLDGASAANAAGTACNKCYVHSLLLVFSF